MTTSRTPRAASSRAKASPAIPAPTMTTSAVGGGGLLSSSLPTAERAISRPSGRRARSATRSPRRTGRSGGRAVGIDGLADEAGERLQAVLALARTGQGTGPALDQLRVGVARGHLGPDLPGADVLAEADDRAAGDASRRVRVGRRLGVRLAGGGRRLRCLDGGASAGRGSGSRGVTAGRPGRIRRGLIQDRPIGRRSDREQRLDARPTGRIERRHEDVATAADRGTRREDEIEVRAAVGEDDQVDIEPSCRAVGPDDGRGHALAAADRDERIARDRSDELGRTGTRQRLAGGLDLGPGPDQQHPVARPDPEPVHQADDRPRRHDPGPVRTRYERDAVVRAGRRHDRAGPDLEMRIRGDRGDQPVVPADGCDAGQDLDPGRLGGRRQLVERPDRITDAGARPPPARIGRGLAIEDRDASPGLGRTQRGEEPGAPAADDEDVGVDAPCRPAGATRRPAVQCQPTASAEPAQHVEIALAQPARAQEAVVVERRRDPARHEPDERQQVALDGWPGVLAARDQTLADRHAARSDARHAVDLALAPAAPAGRAHQPARSMEAEAARQRQPVGGQEAHRERLALDALVGVPVEGEPDEPLAPGRHRPGRLVEPAPQRRWKVGELSMQTRFDSR